MATQSAGILLYRTAQKDIEVMLVHPGGPFWKNKDAGAWTIPKGEFTDGEEPLQAALREFAEETGVFLQGSFIQLEPMLQKSGKKVFAWAAEGDLDVTNISSNMFSTEWPPHSGKQQQFPEIDRAAWFDTKTALHQLLPAQAPFIHQLLILLKR